MTNDKFPDGEIKLLLQRIERLEKENQRLWQENKRAQVAMFQTRIHKVARLFKLPRLLNFNCA